MRLTITAAVFALLALVGCGSDSAKAPVEPTRIEADQPLCPTLGERVPEPDRLERAETALVGLTTKAAGRIAEAGGCHIAPASIDGVPQMLTREYDPSRITVAVRDGEISRVLGFG